MILKKREVEAQLRGKLKCLEDPEGKHTFFYVIHEGKRVAQTHTSHGADEDFGDGRIVQMALQLKVTKDMFVGVVSCSKSRDEYVVELLRHPHLQAPVVAKAPKETKKSKDAKKEAAKRKKRR